MNKSESIAKLAPSLCAAFDEIKWAVKDSTNPHYKSKYADISSIIEAVKIPLLKQGIVFLQGVGGSENMVTVETMLLHSSGEWISSTLEIPASKHDAQGFGSAITYGRRYGLQAMCGVPTADDDGEAATKSAPSVLESALKFASDKPSAKHSPTDGALKSLSAQDQETAKSTAAEIVDLFAKGNGLTGYELFYQSNLDNEMKLAIWELLKPNSLVRTELKKMHKGNE